MIMVLVLYFTEDAVCDGQGRRVSADMAKSLDAVRVLDIAYRSFSKAEFQCRDGENSRIYTVTLDSDSMQALADAILPQTGELEIFCNRGSIQLVLGQKRLQSVRLACGGAAKGVAGELDARFSVDIRFRQDGSPAVLPNAVQTALHKPEQ